MCLHYRQTLIRHWRIGFLCFLFSILLISCASKPVISGNDPLDFVIRESSDYLNNRLNIGIKLVFLNIQSDTPSLSEYVIDGLIENTVNDGLFTVVDRQNLSLIQQEMNFQLSGEVSDESAQAIGKLLGAQVIISGSIYQLGSSYRLRLRAINVETAEILGQFNRDIISSSRLLVLLKNNGVAQSQSGYSVRNSIVPSQTTSSATSNIIGSSESSSLYTTALPYENFIVLRQLNIVNTGRFVLSPDGKYIITESNTGQNLFNTETGNVIKRIDTPSFSVGAFSPDGKRVIVNNGRNIRIIDIETGSFRDCSGHTGTIRSLVYSSDGQYFVSASSSGGIGGNNNDNTVRIWNAETGQEILVIRGNSGGVTSAIYSPDNKIIVSMDTSAICFWNAETGASLRSITRPRSANLMALSPDGSKIAVAAGNNIIVLNAQNGREIYNLTGHSGSIVDLCFNPDGNKLISASGGQGKNLMIWNMSTGWGTENKLSIGVNGYSNLTLSSDGTTLVVNTLGRRTYILGLENN